MTTTPTQYRVVQATSSASEDRGLKRLENPRTRRRLYTLCAIGCYFLTLVLLGARMTHGFSDRKFDLASSDGKFYYAYDVSVLLDHSLDPRLMWEHWTYNHEGDADRLQKDAQGRVRNQYPIGVALTLAPSFLVAHGVALALSSVIHSPLVAPDGYSVPYQLINLAWITLACWSTFVLLDRLLARYFNLSGAAIAVGVLSAWIGTQYFYHLLRFPLMSVVFAPFWATAMVALAADAVDRIETSGEVGWQWPALVFCAVMMIVCRNTNAMLAPFGFYALSVLFRNGLGRRLLPLTPWLPLCAIPLILQMLAWHAQYGHYIANSYGRESTFYWTHPAFWQIMFSMRAGMLLWVPVWTIGTVGAILYVRGGNRGDWITACYLISFLIFWFVNSAYWAWPLSNYPNRGFMELIGLPAVGVALLVNASWKSVMQRRFVLGLLVAGTVFIFVMSLAYDTRRVPRYGDDVNAMGPIGAERAR